jgi:sec-independent protein translocase protein TatA
MFGLGGQELLLILFVILLFFGPSKLPELARGLGRGMREFKKAQADLENEINKAADSVENRETQAAPLSAKNSATSDVQEKS